MQGKLELSWQQRVMSCTPHSTPARLDLGREMHLPPDAVHAPCEDAAGGAANASTVVM